MLSRALTVTLDWFQLHPAVLAWLGVSSIVMFFGTLVLTPLLIAKIPADYFATRRRHPSPWSERHPAVRIVLVVGKNVFGTVLVVAGIAMLVLPGQGLITILIGMAFFDFPRKYALERWIITRPRVLQAINWIRHRYHRPPLHVVDGPSTGQKSRS